MVSLEVAEAVGVEVAEAEVGKIKTAWERFVVRAWVVHHLF